MTPLPARIMRVAGPVMVAVLALVVARVPVYHMPVMENEFLVFPHFHVDSTGRRLLHIAEGFVLHLHQTTLFPDQVLIRTYDSNGGPIDEIIEAMAIQEEIYCDDEHLACVALHTDPNDITVEGILSDSLRIVPVPFPNNTARTNRTRHSHRVFRVKQRNSHPLDSQLTNNITQLTDIDTNELFQRRSQNRTYRIRPEVVIVTDHEHNKQFKTRGDLIRYIGIFMNAVNLRYSTATGIDIKMKITAIIVSKPDQETYWKTQGKYVIADQSLAGFTYRLATGYIPGNFDFAYLITGRDIAQLMPSGSLHPLVAGLAYIGGACTHQRAGLGEDMPGTYDGVHVATHEMAHLLGCVHDGDPPPDYLSDSPGAQDCPWDDGYIMSYKEGGVNKYRFSSCCIETIKHILDRGSHKCLLDDFNYPLTLDKRLPGQVLKPIDYCRVRFPEIPHVWTDNNKQDLLQCRIRCNYPVNYYTGMYVYRIANALDGTVCASNRTCINGVCQ
ncbi:A disintegrin and metalloproteinase with thrombospondin motifs like isoform X2 [Ornithodoros turicata]|uniref:A disintegrin and metalloproteinase with thrombospondin motifs like isoform X2 n=1 Tax=Ornithodoros turicata TaxID=34597 RepID=UPI0031390B84